MFFWNLVSKSLFVFPASEFQSLLGSCLMARSWQWLRMDHVPSITWHTQLLDRRLCLRLGGEPFEMIPPQIHVAAGFGGLEKIVDWTHRDRVGSGAWKSCQPNIHPLPHRLWYKKSFFRIQWVILNFGECSSYEDILLIYLSFKLIEWCIEALFQSALTIINHSQRLSDLGSALR